VYRYSKSEPTLYYALQYYTIIIYHLCDVSEPKRRFTMSLYYIVYYLDCIGKHRRLLETAQLFQEIIESELGGEVKQLHRH